VSKRKNELIKALSIVGESLRVFGEEKEYSSLNQLLDIQFYEEFERIIAFEKNHNGWFTPEVIRQRLLAVAEMLQEDSLTSWTSNYAFTDEPKTIGVIMAGNIPLVGFHDLLSVLLSGNRAVVKMSSDDQHLLPKIFEMMQVFYPEITDLIQFKPNFKSINAMLATGSDNSANYFEKYFGHLPCLIRKNRTSIAILDGSETLEELRLLGSDIFDFYGLGCRNVSQLLIPHGFEMDRFFEAIVDFGNIAENNKYANNYDYHKAIYLMNQVPLLENGFLLTKQSDELFAPVSVLNVFSYHSMEEANQFVDKNKDKIQAVIGHNHIPFGQAQQPALNDYADGVDTIDFLNKNI
jgi:hypothetical protein